MYQALFFSAYEKEPGDEARSALAIYCHGLRSQSIKKHKTHNRHTHQVSAASPGSASLRFRSSTCVPKAIGVHSNECTRFDTQNGALALVAMFT